MRVGKTGTVKVAVPGSMVTGDHKVVVQNASNGVLGWSDLGLANGPYPAAELGSVTVDSTTSTLHAVTSDFPPGTTFSSYQWFRGTTAIPGATTANYTLQAADAGKQLKVQVSATVPGYAKTARASVLTDYSLTKSAGSLAISGVARFDQQLTTVDTLRVRGTRLAGHPDRDLSVAAQRRRDPQRDRPQLPCSSQPTSARSSRFARLRPSRAA